ncbi:glycoside hydrolase family 88 protein [Cohnella sp. JJ-181]|uniref:glycoside hydrolase family 88 protein n=1 Tax=Cohnella rhizoplanae TaxID=2974897 RepID=UPI0022FFC42E|nr:glycoside hydrolase family 88 protein [Cohnella sp. JJ-181]CAI6059839.1 Unsaturated glucuronyl hydrolase [Cohnella sp. JJ-181]
MSATEANTHWPQVAWEHIAGKIRRMSESVGPAFPNGAKDGKYDLAPAHDWVAGFWPGMLWLVYRENPREERLKEIAVACEREIGRTLWEAFDRLHHDVGFMFGLSSVNQYELAGDGEAKRHALMAASLLAGRYNPAGRFIRAWPDWGGEEHSGWAIIDCMMNLPLLYWASREIGDPRYRLIAEMHADTVLREFVLPDGSVHHIVSFDPATGERRGALAGQGFAADSAWSRGAAWALYGFALSYVWTGQARYVQAAERIARYFVAHLPDDHVPYWDFKLPEDGRGMPRDSSAAAIAASGLLELAAALSPAEGGWYRTRAEEMLRSLYTRYAVEDPLEEGLLLHATGYYAQKIYVDAPLIYGDYYYAEAIWKLSRAGARADPQTAGS